MTSQTPSELRHAQTWLDRAKEHESSLPKMDLWKLEVRFDKSSNEWVEQLIIDRSKLRKSPILIAECATAIMNTLDNVFAALAEANGQDRAAGKFHYPFLRSQPLFDPSKQKQASWIGANFVKAIEDHHAQYEHEWIHVAAARLLANSGKHYELKVHREDTQAVAIDVHIPGVKGGAKPGQ